MIVAEAAMPSLVASEGALQKSCTPNQISASAMMMPKRMAPACTLSNGVSGPARKLYWKNGNTNASTSNSERRMLTSGFAPREDSITSDPFLRIRSNSPGASGFSAAGEDFFGMLSRRCYGEDAARAGRNVNYNILQTTLAHCNNYALKCQVDRVPSVTPSSFQDEM